MTWFDTDSKEGRDKLRRHLALYTADSLADYIKRTLRDVELIEEDIAKRRDEQKECRRRVEIAREFLRAPAVARPRKATGQPSTGPSQEGGAS